MASFALVRSDRYLWGARLIQLVFSLAILAVTGEGASLWKDLDCNIPSKLAFNIAAAALTLPVLIYLVFSSGPKWFSRLPWHHWATIGVDAIFFLLWIIATSLSLYDCSGVCAACSPIGLSLDIGYGFWVQYGSLFCECVFSNDVVKMKDRKRALMLLEGRSGSSTGHGGSRDTAALGEKAVDIAVKRGLDIVMIFLFLTTLARAISLVLHARKQGVTAVNGHALEHGRPEMSTQASESDTASKVGPQTSYNEYRGV